MDKTFPWPSVPPILLVKITTYIDSISMCHFQAANKYLNTITKTHSFQLDRAYDHPMNRFIPPDASDPELVYIRWCRINRSSRPTVDPPTRLCMALSYRSSTIREAFEAGECFESPMDIGWTLLNECHSEDDSQKVAPTVYKYYRIAAVAGNLKAYGRLIDLIEQYLPERNSEVPILKRQLLLLGGYSRRYPLYENKAIPSSFGVWEQKFAEAIGIYQRVVRYQLPWRPLPRDAYSRVDDDSELPEYENYLSSVIDTGLEHFESRTIDLFHTTYASHLSSIAIIPYTLANHFQYKDPAKYIQYSLLILKCPIPEEPKSRKSYLNKYFPTLSELMHTPELAKLFLSHLTV